MSALTIAIAGASGRMGQMLVEAVLKDADSQLVAAFDQIGTPAIGKDAGEAIGHPCGIPITDDFAAAIARAQCLIDFTRPAGTLQHLAVCRRHGTHMVIGTTGFDDAGKAAIDAAAQDIPIVFAPNMSVGVNVIFKLLDLATKIMHTGYDVEIVEAHHRMKVDAPSGTALRMGEVVAAALGRDLKDCAVYGREGVTGERDPSTIGFATGRGVYLNFIVPLVAVRESIGWVNVSVPSTLNPVDSSEFASLAGVTVKETAGKAKV
jgi:4-hydroxy-tetrahydrodipicolinate reductase